MHKIDMRGSCNYVIDNRKAGEQVISELPWHCEYYFRPVKDNPPLKEPDDFIRPLEVDSSNLKPFWYIMMVIDYDDWNEADKQFVERRFVCNKKLNFYGTAVTHYIPLEKNMTKLNLAEFSPKAVNSEGHIPLFWRDSTASRPINLEKGVYAIHVDGYSDPFKPVNGIDSHITVKINGKASGGMFLKQGGPLKGSSVLHVQKEKGDIVIELLFDNDVMIGGRDRNAYVNCVYLEKIG
jgi:hypothetical protein